MKNHQQMSPKWVQNPLKIHPKIDPEKRSEKGAGAEPHGEPQGDYNSTRCSAGNVQK